MKRPPTIREGDHVRIVHPLVVVRVGYPKCLKDYKAEVDVEAVAKLVARYMPGRMLRGTSLIRTGTAPAKTVERITWEIAHAMAKADGFGGGERSVHVKEAPELAGWVMRVAGVRSVQTGSYYGASGGACFGGDNDYEPAGLEDRVTRRLARLYVAGYGSGASTGEFTVMADVEIETCNLKKVDPNDG